MSAPNGTTCGRAELAEIVGQFVSEGSHLYIEGKRQTTTWENHQSPEKKYRTEIVASDLVLLGSREKGNGAQPTVSDETEKTKANGSSRYSPCRDLPG